MIVHLLCTYTDSIPLLRTRFSSPTPSPPPPLPAENNVTVFLDFFPPEVNFSRPFTPSSVSSWRKLLLYLLYLYNLLRRGVSSMALQEYDLAEKDLILARKLEPANR